jgi:branched-chain amino acid transport system substrate-binding protein
MTAQFIAKSYEKAGKVDKERFIDALEGMSLDSPVGRMEMRACDHQVALPMFFGVTKKAPQQEFLVASEVVSIPGKDYMPTCEEIRKARAK